MNRRELLLTALVSGLYASWCGRQKLFAQSPAVKTPERILVLGAGMAGLAAASGLSASGHRVTVLEGRDRIGGRIWTNHQFKTPVDLGASWIHGSRDNPITELAQQYQVRTINTDDESMAVYDADGRRLSDDELAELEELAEELIDATEQFGEQRERDISIRHAVNAVLQGEELDADEQRALDYLLASLAVEAGAEMDELSLWYADADDGFDGPDAVFPGGFDAIVRRLAQGLDIRTEHRISQIDYTDSLVRVITDRGVFEADRAIVTLPLGVLKSNLVSFVPTLPVDKRRAIQRLGMGTLNKVALQFPHTFWPDEFDFLGYMSNSMGEFPEFFNQSKYTGAPILVALTGGDFARRMEQRTDDEIVADILRVLRTMYGDTVPDPVRAQVTRWNSDPFAFGSYSHVACGASPEDYDAMAEPVGGGRLLFAGEATHRQFPATVHGAFLSGVREAQRISGMRLR